MPPHLEIAPDPYRKGVLRAVFVLPVIACASVAARYHFAAHAATERLEAGWYNGQPRWMDFATAYNASSQVHRPQLGASEEGSHGPQLGATKTVMVPRRWGTFASEDNSASMSPTLGLSGGPGEAAPMSTRRPFGFAKHGRWNDFATEKNYPTVTPKSRWGAFAWADDSATMLPTTEAGQSGFAQGGRWNFFAAENNRATVHPTARWGVFGSADIRSISPTSTGASSAPAEAAPIPVTVRPTPSPLGFTQGDGRWDVFASESNPTRRPSSDPILGASGSFSPVSSTALRRLIGHHLDEAMHKLTGIRESTSPASDEGSPTLVRSDATAKGGH